MGRGLALAVDLIRRAGPDGRFLPWQLHRRIPSSVWGWFGHALTADLMGTRLLCVLLVGLIGPDLQQFKRKLHKNAPRRGTGAAVWLWLLPVLLGRI